jgi:hypothetical protein
LLVARPLALRDSSFQLTFLAIGCIARLAAPWLERNVQPYAKALRGWRDVTRDAAHEPRAVHILTDGKGVAVTCFVPCLPAIVDGLERAQAPDHNKNQQQ